MNKSGQIHFLLRLRNVALTLFFGGIAATAFAQTSSAAPFPTKPIRIVVGFAAGGPTDVIARIIGQDMSAMFGQSVVIDNRTGAKLLSGEYLTVFGSRIAFTLCDNDAKSSV